MRAILLAEPGGPDQLRLGEYPTPEPTDDEVLVAVATTALNRADLLQRAGKYPPPPGASPLLGLEMAGHVVRAGARAGHWREGDAVCALLSGGGYAEYVAVHHRMLRPVPAGWAMTDAAAVPEVFMTAFQSLVWLGRVQPGERLLVHAGGSGVGTAAIQLARALGAEVFVTASAGKHALCRRLGAQHTIDYQQTDFAEAVADITNGEGVDVVLDFLAAPYLARNLQSLRTDGRLVMLATMGGTRLEHFDLRPFLAKRLQLIGSTLRTRPRDYQIALTDALWEFAGPRFANGTLRPVVDSVFDWQDVAAAHRYMEANKNTGKIVLKII